MKKSLLALSVATIALSGVAATPKQQQRHASSNLSFDRNIELQTRCERKAPSRKAMKKAPSRINSAADIIDSAEGRRQNMTVTASGYYLYGGMFLDEYQDQSFATHVVYGDDNDVYIYDIVPALSLDSYVKGRMEGDKIVVDLPQTVLWDDEYEDGVNVNICEYFYNEEYEEEDYAPVENASLILSVAEDGSLLAEGLDEDHILGLSFCSDDMWTGYGAWSLAMSPFDGALVTVPDDLEVSKDFWTYTCDYLGYGWPVSFAQGEDLYFQGLSEVMPEAWVKATVDYDYTEAHVYIDQNQYVGIYYGYYVYTKCAKILVDEEEGYEYYELMPDDYRFELIWDYEEETMVPKDPTVSLLFNIAKDEVYYIDELYEFVLSINDGYEGTPASPYNLDYYDYMKDYGFSVFEFYLPALSTDGELLQTSDLSYVVYIDDEEWTFDEDEYMLDEPMVEIPWEFDNEETILKFFGSCRHAVYLFAEGISSLGVQSIYRYNGEETRSEIVTLNLEGDPSGVAAIGAGKKVADVKYYGIDGREVANPAAGIFIKRVTFEDGSVATFKKAVR